MTNTRGFAYNPNLIEVPGVLTIGTLSVGMDESIDYSTKPGGLTWWIGPDEEKSYVIAKDDSSENLPLELQENGIVMFWLCVPLEQHFVSLVSRISSSTQESKESALTWLAENGYWTNCE